MEQIVSFKTALLAKKKGFDELCHYFVFDHDSKEIQSAEETFWSRSTSGKSFHEDEYGDTKCKNSTIRDSMASKVGLLEGEDTFTCIPTQDVLHRWMREKHGLHVIVIPTINSSWTFKSITVLSERDEDIIKGIKSVSDLPPYEDVHGYDYSTYEEALESGLLECLNQIKEP